LQEVNFIPLSSTRAFKTGIPKTGIPGSRMIFQNQNFGINLPQNRYFSVLTNDALDFILLTYFESFLNHFFIMPTELRKSLIARGFFVSKSLYTIHGMGMKTMEKQFVKRLLLRWSI
jgi:hypothetical protein